MRAHYPRSFIDIFWVREHGLAAAQHYHCVVIMNGNYIQQILFGRMIVYLLQRLAGDAIYFDELLPAVLLLVIDQILLVDLADERAAIVYGAQSGLVIVVTASAVTPVEKLRFWRERNQAAAGAALVTGKCG